MALSLQYLQKYIFITLTVFVLPHTLSTSISTQHPFVCGKFPSNIKSIPHNGDSDILLFYATDPMHTHLCILHNIYKHQLNATVLFGNRYGQGQILRLKLMGMLDAESNSTHPLRGEDVLELCQRIFRLWSSWHLETCATCTDIFKLQMSLLLTWLTLIPACLSNYTHYKVWDIIPYPFPNFNGCTVEFWEWVSNFTPHLTRCDYSSMLGPKLIM